MDKPPLADLIDNYLLGKLTPEDKAILFQRAAADPEIDTQLKESLEAFKAIRVAQWKARKEKLKQIDEEEERGKPGFFKTIFLLSVFFLSILIGWQWASEYYSDQSLADRYAILVHASETTTEGIDVRYQALTSAEAAFQSREYEKAMQLYASWQAENGLTNDPLVQWQLLLSELAKEGYTAHLERKLLEFMMTSQSLYAGKAMELHSLLQSPLYQFFFVQSRRPIQVLKPRFI